MTTADRSGHRLFYCLDGMRAIASLLIVIRHTPHYFGNNVDSSQSYLAVDLFFVLSGVVIANAYEVKLLTDMSFRDFIFVRMIRLYPLYILGAALGLFVYSLLFGDSIVGIIYHGIASAFFIPNPSMYSLNIFPTNGPLWSLFFELCINIFYAGTVKYLSEKRLIVIMLVSAIFLVGGILTSPQHADIGWNVRTFLDGFPRVGFSFYAGVLIYRLSVKNGNGIRRNNFVPWILIGCVIAILAAQIPENMKSGFDILAILCLFPALVYTGLYWQPHGLTESLFKTGGILSYAIYVIHQPLGSLIEAIYLYYFNRNISECAPIAGVVFCSLLILACLGLDRYYDRPLRKILQLRMRRKEA